MNRDQIQARLNSIQQIYKNDRRYEDAFSYLVSFVRDLALEVSEFQPEEISEEEIRPILDGMKEHNTAELIANWDREDASRREREKLAEELVSLILRDDGMFPPHILSAATQLKVKLDAAKER